ncbi:hypothetical protein ABT354_32835 [Streptomyces sp. NPDC000594]|uniref:hypothetical protein n=1 Tax=Streptomyces sp. NPDC000594 TaxID=3154261 RepID=UPI0033269FDB
MTSELSGVDLARWVLVAAREAAEKNGSATRKSKRRTTTVVRRDGREPLGLGSAIGRMMTEPAWSPRPPAASSSPTPTPILAAVMPELTGRVKAVAFDTDTGRLDLAPMPWLSARSCAGARRN